MTIQELKAELRRTAEKAEPIAVELYGDRLFGGPYSRADLSAAQDAYIEAAQPSAILALLEHVEGLEKRCGQLNALLTELYATVVGECPSLLNEDSGGSERLDAEICAALAEQGEKI